MLLVAQAVRPALNDAHLVVEAFDEAAGDLILGPQVANSFLVLAAASQKAIRAACDPDVIAWR